MAVLDFIVGDIQQLVRWFKNCSYDDFDTIYKIVRKLKLLDLDVEAIKSDGPFDINRTNLFYISDEDMQKFVKIDGMLNENTLYELFQSQMKVNFVLEEE